MRLPNTAYTSQSLADPRAHPGFPAQDVYELATPGGPDDFPLLEQRIVAGDPSLGSRSATRTLRSIRWKLGALLDWDRPDAGLGSRVPTPPRPIACRSVLPLLPEGG
jgi:Protein of unknown function (DUF2867)